MVEDVALEVKPEEALRREPLTAADVFELRRELFRTENARDAFLKLLDDKFPANSRDADLLFRRGVGMFAAGKNGDARILLADSKKPLAGYLLAQLALDRDDAVEAKRLLEKHVDRDQPAEYRVCFAEALARLDEGDGLQKILADLTKQDPQGADTLYLDGRVKEMRGDYADAVSAYEHACALQPDHRWSRFRLAYRLDLMGRDDEATQHYERLKQVFPVPVGALLNLGILYEDQDKNERAANCYRLALTHDYNHPVANMYAADARASIEQYYDEEKERKDDKRAQILKIPVTDFELSVRSRNCLARMNIRSLGDLVRKSEAELLSFKNFGETSLNEIKEILRSKGLRLGMHSDEDERAAQRRRQTIDRDANRARQISELDLSVRSRKALDTLKIMTVGQLCEVTEDQLLACKNFGQTSLNEIKKKLADLGLSLRG